MRGLIILLSLFFGLGSPALAAVPAAPAPVAPFGAVTGETLVFTWGGVPGATWYQLWIEDAEAAPRIARWYTASAAGCGSGGGTCTVSLTAGLSVGRVRWWVRGWNAEGNGAWSLGKSFTLRLLPPSWSASLPPAERFQVVLDGTWVLDRETGLVWQRQPAEFTSTWQTARYNCLATTAALGRLPSIQELRSVAAAFTDSSSEAPFIGILNATFWSASDYPGNADYALHTGTNYQFGSRLKTSTSRFWCIRGPGAAPP